MKRSTPGASVLHFLPDTCSEYAVQAIQKYGALKGGWMALKRICRCHPFSKRDRYDPVP